jgi:hypothetical protein
VMLVKLTYNSYLFKRFQSAASRPAGSRCALPSLALPRPTADRSCCCASRHAREWSSVHLCARAACVRLRACVRACVRACACVFVCASRCGLQCAQRCYGASTLGLRRAPHCARASRSWTTCAGLRWRTRPCATQRTCNSRLTRACDRWRSARLGSAALSDAALAPCPYGRHVKVGGLAESQHRVRFACVVRGSWLGQWEVQQMRLPETRQATVLQRVAPCCRCSSRWSSTTRSGCGWRSTRLG